VGIPTLFIFVCARVSGVSLACLLRVSVPQHIYMYICIYVCVYIYIYAQNVNRQEDRSGEDMMFEDSGAVEDPTIGDTSLDRLFCITVCFTVSSQEIRFSMELS